MLLLMQNYLYRLILTFNSVFVEMYEKFTKQEQEIRKKVKWAALNIV